MGMNVGMGIVNSSPTAPLLPMMDEIIGLTIEMEATVNKIEINLYGSMDNKFMKAMPPEKGGDSIREKQAVILSRLQNIRSQLSDIQSRF